MHVPRNLQALFLPVCGRVKFELRCLGSRQRERIGRRREHFGVVENAEGPTYGRSRYGDARQRCIGLVVERRALEFGARLRDF